MEKIVIKKCKYSWFYDYTWKLKATFSFYSTLYSKTKSLLLLTSSVIMLYLNFRIEFWKLGMIKNQNNFKYLIVLKSNKLCSSTSNILIILNQNVDVVLPKYLHFLADFTLRAVSSIYNQPILWLRLLVHDKDMDLFDMRLL